MLQLFSASPYTWRDLLEAKHEHELPGRVGDRGKLRAGGGGAADGAAGGDDGGCSGGGRGADADVDGVSDDDAPLHVHLDAAHMGVGGDDSWSPSVHDTYLVPPGVYDFSVALLPCRFT